MKRHRAAVVVFTLFIVAIAGVAAGCGGSESSAKAGTGRASGGTSAESYVGLSKREAIAKAEAADQPWRIVRQDDETFPATMDYLPNRVSFEIDDGKVTEATLGERRFDQASVSLALR